MMPKKLVFLFFGSVMSLIILASLLAISVDPYGVFGNQAFQSSKWKPAQVMKTRYAKAVSVLYKKPNAIILGNSRTEYGLDPEHAYFDGLNAYNLAFSSQSIYESYRYLIHANEVSGIKKVLLAIDFDSFNNGTKTGFNQEYLCNEIEPCISYVRLLKETVSFESLNAVFDTLTNTEITRYFHLDNGMRDPEHNKYFIKKEGGYRNAFRIFEDHVINDYGVGVARINKHALDTLIKILTYTHENNIDTVLMFSPAHVRLWELLDVSKTNGFNTWLDWKKVIMESNIEVANKFGREPYKLWDFAAYNEYTTEDFPPSMNKGDVMHYHWDTSHYKKELGDLALNVISETSQKIGIPLTGFNIDGHLSSLKSLRSAWVKAHFDKSDFKRKGFVSADEEIINNKKYFPDILNIKYKNLVKTHSNGKLEATSNDPYVVFNFKKRINGGLINYIGFNFNCVDKKKKTPKLQMFWWDDTHEWFSEKNSVNSKIGDGLSIIYLGSNENWKNSTSIRSIRIDVPNKDACEKVTLDGVFYGNKTH